MNEIIKTVGLYYYFLIVNKKRSFIIPCKIVVQEDTVNEVNEHLSTKGMRVNTRKHFSVRVVKTVFFPSVQHSELCFINPSRSPHFSIF